MHQFMAQDRADIAAPQFFNRTQVHGIPCPRGKALGRRTGDLFEHRIAGVQVDRPRTCGEGTKAFRGTQRGLQIRLQQRRRIRIAQP